MLEDANRWLTGPSRGESPLAARPPHDARQLRRLAAARPTDCAGCVLFRHLFLSSCSSCILVCFCAAAQILRVGNTDGTGLGVTDLRNLIIGEQVFCSPFPPWCLYCTLR